MLFFLHQSFETWLLQFPSIANPQVNQYAIWPLNTQPPQWAMLFLAAPQCGATFELLIGTGLSLIILGSMCLISKKSTTCTNV